MAVRGAFLSPIIGFAKLQLLAWAIFVRCPVLLVGGAYLLLQWRRRVSLASIMLAIILFAMGVDAFPIEPH